MTEEQRVLSGLRMENAHATLAEGRLLLESGMVRGSVNRAYDAAFYAARSILATRGLDAAKHSTIISLFDREFVKPNILPRDLSKTLHDFFDARQVGDYRDRMPTTIEVAAELTDRATHFVERVAVLLEQLEPPAG